MPEWYEGLDAEHLEHVTGKGWNKPLTPEIALAMATSHRAAEKHIGAPADKILRLPNDASDPAYKSIYDRVVGMSTPKDIAEYTFDDVRFKDGNGLDDADKKFVADLAFAHKLPVATARAIAASLAGRAETLAAEDAAATGLTRQANGVALRQAWGAEYDQKAFAASKAVEAFPQGVRDAIELLPAPDYVKTMTALLGYGQAMTEAAMLLGGRGADPNAGMTAEQADVKLRQLQADPKWAADALAGVGEAKRTWDQLVSIIARGRVG